MRVLSPTSGPPVWGSDTGKRRSQSIWLKPSRAWLQELHGIGENRGFTLIGRTQNLMHTRNKGKTTIS